MNKIPKCRTKYFIPQGNNIKVAPKDSIKEHLVPKITQKNLKFSANRQFGKDITNANSLKSNMPSININHSTKNNIYIKKHSSASQVSQKTKKLKIAINDKKIRENKSGSMIKKKKDICSSDFYYKDDNLKNDNNPKQGGSKLHNEISFGANKRPMTSINNCISVRITKNNKIHTSLNNKSINMVNNNNYVDKGINNNKIEITHSNLDLM